MSKIEGLITECGFENIGYGHLIREARTTLTIVVEGYAPLDPSKPVTLTQAEEGA